MKKLLFLLVLIGLMSVGVVSGAGVCSSVPGCIGETSPRSVEPFFEEHILGCSWTNGVEDRCLNGRWYFVGGFLIECQSCDRDGTNCASVEELVVEEFLCTGTCDCNDFLSGFPEPVSDTDGDGFDDDVDVCVDDYNPDQSDIDGSCPVPPGQCGDVCDVCPDDATDTCEAGSGAGENVNASGLTFSNPSGEVTIAIPAGALSTDTSISMTKGGSNFQLSLPGRSVTVVYEYTLGIPGTSFSTDITLTFLYDDSQFDFTKVQVFHDTGSGFELVDFDCSTVPGVCTGTVSSFSVIILIVPTDTDGDGVPDEFDGVVDQCAASPSGVPVASSGCTKGQLVNVRSQGKGPSLDTPGLNKKIPKGLEKTTGAVAADSNAATWLGLISVLAIIALVIVSINAFNALARKK